MFWRVSGFAQPSPVEAALDRPNCSLEDLLAEDDLIQVGYSHLVFMVCSCTCIALSHLGAAHAGGQSAQLAGAG